jgi:hypothetical protein
MRHQLSIVARGWHEMEGCERRWLTPGVAGRDATGITCRDRVDVETRGRPAESSWRIGANLASAGASLYRPLTERSGMWGTANLTDVTLITRMNGTEDTYPDVPRSGRVRLAGSIPALLGGEPGATRRECRERVVMLHEGFITESSRNGHREGWSSCFDRLERMFA